MIFDLVNYFDYIGYSIPVASTSVIGCKIKNYSFYLAIVLPSSFILLACFDRLMLSSSNANTRSWSQRRIAYRLVAVVSIFWAFFSIHAFFGSYLETSFSFSYCTVESGSYTLFVTLYLIIMVYVATPILMAILGMMTIINVQRAKNRVRPAGEAEYMQRKDRNLLRMLLFQVLFNVIFILPLGVFQVSTILN